MNARRKWVATVLLLSVILITGCAKSPESTVRSFYRAVEKGELTEARSYVSSQILQMLGEAKISVALSGETEKIGKCGGIKDIDVKLEGKGQVRSGIAVVTFAGQCPPSTEKVKMIKEDGKWKLTAEK